MGSEMCIRDRASALGLGVTIGDHTFTMAQDVLVVAAMSAIALGAAIWAFNRQE